MAILEDGIGVLIKNGLVELLIFALIFALVYGILESVRLFGDDEGANKYNLLIAIAFGLLVIVPSFVAPGSSYDIVPLVEKAIPQTMLVAVAALGLIILLGLFGMQSFHEDKSWNWAVALVILALIVYIFVGATGRVWGLPNWFTPDLVAAALAVLVFGGVIMFVMGGKDDESPPAGP